MPYVSFEIVVPIETSMLKVKKVATPHGRCHWNAVHITRTYYKFWVVRTNTLHVTIYIELCLFITSEFVQVTVWKWLICTPFEIDRSVFVTELGSMLWHWNSHSVSQISCFLVGFTQFLRVPSVEDMATNLNHFQIGVVSHSWDIDFHLTVTLGLRSSTTARF